MTVKNIYAYPPLALDCSVRQTVPVKNLAHIRKLRGLSQAQLAEMAGCTQGVVSKIERGKANPTLDVIEALASALRVPEAALFGLGALQDRVLLTFADIPEDQRDAALIVLDAMAASRPGRK